MYSKCIPRVFQGYSKCITRVFQGYSKCIPSVFQGYSKGIPSVFQGYSCIPRVCWGVFLNAYCIPFAFSVFPNLGEIPFQCSQGPMKSPCKWNTAQTNPIQEYKQGIHLGYKIICWQCMPVLIVISIYHVSVYFPLTTNPMYFRLCFDGNLMASLDAQMDLENMFPIC